MAAAAAVVVSTTARPLVRHRALMSVVHPPRAPLPSRWDAAARRMGHRLRGSAIECRWRCVRAVGPKPAALVHR
eukprot:scaffold2200_cov413-Prasinococcus_capsulatus_cf.AAC.32